MASNSPLHNTINQNDPKMEQQSKYRVLFNYSLSTPLHPPKPEWSSKRLAKVQERRPIKNPTFAYLNPMDAKQYRNDISSIGTAVEIKTKK
ncbi:unnamed protein product [Rotaria sordida]|uniref:Uncharacterized protein n=1 Tax=Rotaria sordida TaxID=392033 RepID=A0A815QL91_9BILA|nr:unnamed protein product [Rotaria sordida]CAF4275561.1 unnamed protein product [Rotaria sordida]